MKKASLCLITYKIFAYEIYIHLQVDEFGKCVEEFDIEQRTTSKLKDLKALVDIDMFQFSELVNKNIDEFCSMFNLN